MMRFGGMVLGGVWLVCGAAWAGVGGRDEFDSVESILQVRAQATAADRELAAGLMEDGRKRAARDPAYYGPLFKAWCGSAVVFPEAESLVQCAHFHVAMLKEASNLQQLPSALKESALKEECRKRAQEALVLLQAAESLLQEGDAPEGLAERINRDRARYQRIIGNPEALAADGDRCLGM